MRSEELCSREGSLHPYLFPFFLANFSTPLLLRIIDLEGYTGSDLYDHVARRIARFHPDRAPHAHTASPEPPTKKRTADRRERREHRTQTRISNPDLCGGPAPRFGFRLRLASRDGKRCSLCLWYECCIGCLVPDDDFPAIVQDGDTVALDWHLSAPVRAKEEVSRKHFSARDGTAHGQGSIALEECLDSFAEEEKIPEAFCSKCKDFRVSTKRMSIWRLPPVLIIHLKRFQFTPHSRKKLRNLVVFPTEGLDLSRIVCSSSDSSLDKTNHQSSLYDLYGVVHHQGALSAGHYCASIKFESDDTWRLYNDALVYDIDAKDVVDSSAYILFYIRRDAKKAKLEDFWDTRDRDGQGVTEEQIDKLVKSRERCVIS